jgi:hypothetical protein
VALLAASLLSACSKPTADDSARDAAASAETAPASAAVSTAQSASAGDPLSAAFQAAFPQGATETISVGGGDDASSGGGSGDDGYPLTFTAKTLVPVADGVVALVAEGEDPDACHVCVGKLSVTYLKPTGDGYAPLDPPVSTMIDGDGFGGAPDWKVASGSSGPTLRIKTSYGDQGCSATSVIVYRLKPDGIVEDKAASKSGAEACS